MLNESQIEILWRDLIGAETRTLYFADLASRYTRLKQIITGISWFLSSGAAVAMIGRFPLWVGLTFAAIIAGANAYAMAVGLDRKSGTMVRLHSSWAHLAADYGRLWNHAYDDDAEARFEAIGERAMEPSALAQTDAPNDQKLLGKWEEHVFRMRHLTDAT